MKVKVSVPGTCGEWIQTVYDKDGSECLVSATIGLYNEIVAFETDRATALRSQAHLLPKAKAALVRVSAFLEIERKVLEQIAIYRGEMALSIGKGMASSTADIAGIMMALSLLSGKPLDPSTLFKLCCDIEPSDGTMLPGTELIDHLHGRRLESFDALPQAEILMLLPHTVFDTQKLRLRDDYSEKLHQKSTLPLTWFRQGAESGDLALMGKAATQSLLENEPILSKSYLNELIELAQRNQCHGIIGGHSGTVAGILLKKGTDVQKLRFELDNSSLNRYYNEMMLVQTVNGGMTYEVTEA